MLYRLAMLGFGLFAIADSFAEHSSTTLSLHSTSSHDPLIVVSLTFFPLFTGKSHNHKPLQPPARSVDEVSTSLSTSIGSSYIQHRRKEHKLRKCAKACIVHFSDLNMKTNICTFACMFSRTISMLYNSNCVAGIGFYAHIPLKDPIVNCFSGQGTCSPTNSTCTMDCVIDIIGDPRTSRVSSQSIRQDTAPAFPSTAFSSAPKFPSLAQRHTKKPDETECIHTCARKYPDFDLATIMCSQICMCAYVLPVLYSAHLVTGISKQKHPITDLAHCSSICDDPADSPCIMKCIISAVDSPRPTRVAAHFARQASMPTSTSICVFGDTSSSCFSLPPATPKARFQGSPIIRDCQYAATTSSATAVGFL